MSGRRAKAAVSRRAVPFSTHVPSIACASHDDISMEPQPACGCVSARIQPAPVPLEAKRDRGSQLISPEGLSARGDYAFACCRRA